MRQTSLQPLVSGSAVYLPLPVRLRDQSGVLKCRRHCPNVILELVANITAANWECSIGTGQGITTDADLYIWRLVDDFQS